jgi:ferritin-like metal-binding protein YciE
MAKSKTLRELFITKLQALYDIESELVDALPKMAEGAKDPELQTAFEDHLEETKEHVERLENIFDLLEEEPTKLKTEAIRGLVKDSEWMMKNTEEGDVRDAALISAARYVEHYEMAGYMGAQEWAEMLADEGVSSILEKTLEEEQAAEEKLSELATQVSERLNSDADEDEED